ncbi:MAG: DUF2188 domain-containing protein [Eubacterium sp.]|nr:DUF2188 domain-containing protein [Eubacterium sp.]
MSRDEHHVVPNPNGGWDIKRNGSNRASAHTEIKKDAINKARIISRNQNTELIVHNKDGKIANPDSHGNDPCPPRDKK